MTQEQHPITPPPELVHEWQIKIEYASRRADREALVSKVFQLGADYELEACCEWLAKEFPRERAVLQALRKARRPKPPSLKEQALTELDALEDMGTCNSETIRRAIESIPDEQ